MTDKNKNVSLLLLLGVLFFALPLHADELSEEQIKEISALWDEAQRLVGEEDYQAALKITEQVLDKLDQWRADEFSLYAWQELEVKILMRDQQYPAASKKQKELLSLTKDLFGDKAPKTVEARALLSDLRKIASLTPEQQKELSEGDAAYHAAVAEGDLEKAIALGEQMAANEKKYLGEDCTWYANSLSLLAGNYIATGKYKQAEAKYLEGIKIIEKLYGQMHLNTATWCDFLATLYSELGEEEKANPLLTRIFAIRNPIYGDKLKSQVQKANSLLKNEDKLDQFLYENLKSIELLDFIFGKNNNASKKRCELQVAKLVDKAIAQKKIGDLKGLKQSLGEAIVFANVSVGSEDTDVLIARSLVLMAKIYIDIKDFVAAERLLKQSSILSEKALGSDHPDVAEALNNLGQFYSKQGKHAEAELCYERALAIFEKAFGSQHAYVATVANNLGSLYHDQGKYAEARPLFERSLAIREKVFDPDHRDVAVALNNLGLLYETQGKYAEAEPLLIRVLAINEKADGQDHSDVAAALNNLAYLYNSQGKYAEAAPLFERSLSICEKALGPDHPDFAMGLNNLGQFYSEQGKYAQAEPMLVRALAIKEKTFGQDHLVVASTLGNLAGLYMDQGKYTEAEALFERAIAIYEKAFGPDHPDVALQLNNLGRLYDNQGKYAEAEPLLKRALAISEKAFGPEHPEVALVLNSLSGLYATQGKYTEAEALFERALDINEKAFGPDHREVAMVLNNLGGLYATQGKYLEAESLYKRALTIREKAFGPDHPDVALQLNNLGQFYSEQGKYAQAEPMLVRALAIYEKTFGSDHPKLPAVLSNLSSLYYEQGKYAEAAPLYERALAISKKSFGPDHPDVARALSNLGRLYDSQGKYVEAELCHERALAIFEKALGPEHASVGAVTINLGNVYEHQGKYAAAELMLLRALAINEKAFGPEHPDVAQALNNLSVLCATQGKHTEAEPMLVRALAIDEKAFGPDHPHVALRLNNLGSIYQHQGKYAEAVTLKKRGVELDLKNLEANASVQSERQQLVALDKVAFDVGRCVDAYLRLKGKYDEAYQMVLASKGAVTRRQQIMRTFADSPELEPLFAQLQSTASQLSTAYSSNKQIDPQVRKDRIDKLIKQKEAIQQQLSRQSQSFRQAVQEMTPQGLQTALPQNSLLIDFVEHFINERDKSEQKPTNKIISRLAAFIIRPEGPIELVDLCSREELQLAIFFWKENLSRNTGPATELGKLIWEPLAEHVDDAELVLYSPIAELGSVPFAALPGKKPGSYLLEEKQLVMIPQAKLLPSLLEREQSPKPTVLAIGGVDYESVAENETEEPVQLAASRRAVRWNEEALFTPLPETESELEAVGKLYNQQFDLGKLQTLKDDRATEAAVKRLAPQYSHLHFATHGFFAPPGVKSAFDNSENRFERQLSFDDQPRFTGFHPGLLSGLALAGANDPPKEGEDGIWTAEEVATMNLSNVDLAVLSACETGLGKVAGGEGLLGLQRAFQVSGAGTTVASLWQVDDAATRVLMDEFYRNLWEKKLPKIEALRQAQLKMLREYDPQKGTLRGVGGVRQFDTDGQPERLPPFYWAAWVLSGDWR